ncbi:MAG: hypothetical protein NZM25_08020 [Leptospiraceae bacterium]|nr:hypothetical protein [Leptospiraceae bacterium]MDW8305547.1 hypothetical protein [Leptospiraceae bacterium]
MEAIVRRFLFALGFSIKLYAENFSPHGKLGVNFLLPALGQKMLARENLAADWHPLPNLALSLSLEKRHWQDLYRESRFTVVPSYHLGSFAFGLGYLGQEIAIDELNYLQRERMVVFYFSYVQEVYLLKLRYAHPSFYWAEIALLKEIFIPIEWNLQLIQDQGFFDGITFSALLYLLPEAGVGAGYEIKSASLQFCAYLRPTSFLLLRADFYLASGLRNQNAYFVKLEYHFGTQELPRPKQENSYKKTPRENQTYEFPNEQKPSLPKIRPPSFTELIRLGVPAEEALAISRSGNLCGAKKDTLLLLAARGWRCLEE